MGGRQVSSIPIRYGELFFLREMAKKTAHVATIRHLLLLPPLIAITSLEYFILTPRKFKIAFWFPT